MNRDEILNLKLDNSDFHKDLTIKGYFYELLTTLWEEEEGFSGKRPFGNSGWKYDLYKPLIKNGIIEGRLDEDGYVEELNKEQADNLIRLLIAYSFYR